VIIVRSTGSFYRAAIPKDITSGAPNPSEWGKPSATLQASQCNIGKFFSNHSIIFGEQPHCVRTRDFLTNTTQTLHFAVSLHGVVIHVCSERKCRRLGREFICYFGMPWNLRREIDGSKELCGNTNFPLRERIILTFLFQNASWSINSLKVYRKQLLANVRGAAPARLSTIGIWTLLSFCISGTALLLNI